MRTHMQTDEINQFTFPPRAPLREKASFYRDMRD